MTVQNTTSAESDLDARGAERALAFAYDLPGGVIGGAGTGGFVLGGPGGSVSGGPGGVIGGASTGGFVLGGPGGTVDGGPGGVIGA